MKTRKLGKYIKCKYCGLETYVYPSRFSKIKNIYCSKKCLYLDRKKNGFEGGKCSFRHTNESRKLISKKKTGVKFSEEHRKNISESKKGEKAYQWKKDRTKLKKSEKKHLDVRYREWMKAVKDRDKWQCKINNGDCSGRLEAHHILDWVNYPELRYDINNGITLCQAHHPRGRVKEKRMIPTFMELLSVSKE